MDFKPPQNARDVAIEVGQSQKPPQNRAADRRHVIASAIRRAGEFFGQTDQANEAADEFQLDPTMFDEPQPQRVPGGLQVQPQTMADRATSVDSPATGDLSLADIILADQAASRGFAMPLAMPDNGRLPLLGSSFDASPSPGWPVEASAQADSSASPPAWSEFAQFVDRSIPPDIASDNMPAATPVEFPPIQNSQFDASAFGEFNPPSPGPVSPPAVSDLVGRYDAADRPSIVQLPYNLADEPAGPTIELLSNGAAGALPKGEDRAPIAYLPFGQSVPWSNGDSAPREKRKFEIELSIAEVERDSVLTFTAMEPAFVKLVDQMGEQDRHDAFARAASRRACL